MIPEIKTKNIKPIIRKRIEEIIEKLKFAYYWFLLGTDFTDFHDKKE